MDRNDLILNFLKKNNLDNAVFNWLPSDASFRHYARIKTEDKSYILMDAPPPEIPEQFAVVDKILCDNDLSAPIIYDTDFENGFILLEDFGNDSYNILLSKGVNELELYKTSVKALLKITEISNFKGIPLYDKDWFFQGLSIFVDWFIPNAIGRQLSNSERKEFFLIWENLFDSIKEAPTGLVLNDFHILNMMHLDRKGHKECGLLDFQDARIGPLAYDLVSLLEDARRETIVPKAIQNEILNYYLDAKKEFDRDLFMRSYHIMAAKRHTRVLGIFTRLKIRDKKDNYLNLIPHVWNLLEEKLNEPCLAKLKDWFDVVIPKDYRKIPSCLETC